MGLFQQSVLNKYLGDLDQKQLDPAWEKFTAHFHNPTIQENIRNSKEEQYQGEFLIDLFVNIMGYVKNPTPDFNLTTELKNVKDSKKVDGAILKEDKAIAVIELKGTNIVDLGKVEVQAFGYKNNQPGCTYVVTSNFEKLRFYIDNAVEYESFNLFKLSKHEFEVLWLCLHESNLINGIPKQIKNESLTHEENVTKKLYKEYSEFRNEIFDNILNNNPQYDKLVLFKKTQKLLDRFLFIFFAEDRLLLPPNSIREIVNQWTDLKDKYDEYQPLYSRFKKYFGYMDIGYHGQKHDIFAYNGGLFAPDPILDSITIDDRLLYEHTLNLSNYDFESEVSVNILGHIFEQSLTDIENIQAQLSGTEIEKSKTKRKKDGVFYTPNYITKYMVESSVGELCREKKAELKIVEEDYEKERKGRRKATLQGLLKKLDTYRKWLLQITICDPACGSGAFLNQTLEYLISEHKYIDELQTRLLGGGMVLSNVESTILENNLFGVDINEESVDIAKLSLWLRTAKKGRKLTSLSKHIKCGNSLIDDPTIAGDKSFYWEKEFPDIFANGGFDVVIGNPPYVDIKGLDKEQVDYIFKTYRSANNRINLYSTFIERALSLLNHNRYLSFIIPSSILTQESYKALRQLLLEKATISGIVRLPNESFGGGVGEVKVDTIILTIQSLVIKAAEVDIIVYEGFDRINEVAEYNSDHHYSTSLKDWEDDENHIFRINVDDSTIKILDKCREGALDLSKCADFCLGLTPYDKYKGHTQEQIKNKVFHSDHKKDQSFRKLLAGNDIVRYNVQWCGDKWISYGNWLGAPRDQRFFTEKRILVKQIIDWSDKRIWATLTDEELYNTQNAFNIIAHEGYKHEYLLALINSKLLSFYHKKQFLEEYKDRFQKILIKDAKKFPVKNISLDNQAEFTKKVQNLIQSYKELNNNSDKFVNYMKSKFSLSSISRNLNRWYELESDVFLKEFGKTLKKAGQNKMSSSEEIDWLEVFEMKKGKIHSLKKTIDWEEHSIDSQIYDIYNLNDEEISIVENS